VVTAEMIVTSFGELVEARSPLQEPPEPERVPEPEPEPEPELETEAGPTTV
jgi:hypothetical protein